MTALVPITPAALVPVVAAGTLASFVGPFLNTLRYVRERSEHTVMAYGHDLATFLRFCDLAGLVTPEQVKAKHVELYVAWLRQERGAAKTTAARHLSCLREFWRFLEREEITTRNPAATAYGPKATRRMPVYLKIAEQERLLDVMAGNRSVVGQRDYTIVAVMLFAGLRVSEVVTLKVDDVDLDGATLRIHHAKGDKDREIPIIPRLGAILRDYLGLRARVLAAPRGWLRRQTGPGRAGYWEMTYFDARGECVCRSTRRRDRQEAERVLLEAIGTRPPPPLPWLFVTVRDRRVGGREVEPLLTRSVYLIIRSKVSPIVGRKLHPHALRHSFASRLRENDADLALIQEALGHSNIATTMVYAHLSTAKRMRDLTKHLEGA